MPNFLSRIKKERLNDIRTAERPIRDRFENFADRTSRGPLGYVGNGNAVGGASYFTTSFINKFNPIAGTNVGYRIISHNVERTTDSEEVHTFKIDSWLEETSRFAAKIKSPPSVVDFFRENTHIVSVEPITKRRTSTTWKVKVKVTPRRHVTE